jgi:hypothetical protein
MANVSLCGLMTSSTLLNLIIVATLSWRDGRPATPA